MKLSDTTVAILKNFSQINGNLYIPKGNTIRTMRANKGCLAQAMIAESFDHDVGIYSMNQLLAVIGLHDDAELTLHDDHMVVTNGAGNISTNYRYAAKDLLTVPPDKDLSLDKEACITFMLPADILKKALRAAAVLQNKELAVRSVNGNLEVAAVNTEHSLANEFTVGLGACPKSFNLILQLDNVKPLELDYEVMVDPRCILQLNGDMNGTQVSYWLPSTDDSTHEDAAE